jgi:hypothetical protein
MSADLPKSAAGSPPSPRTLAQQLGETAAHTPLWLRARRLGLLPRDQLLALAVQRGARHYAGLAAPAVAQSASAAFSDEELVVLLLHGRNAFEPFLIRAAAELIRRLALDPARLAFAARRERCQRALAYLAEAGGRHDTPGAYPWGVLRAALGPQRPVPPGLMPHWSRFVALEGIDRQGRDRGRRWIGAAA